MNLLEKIVGFSEHRKILVAFGDHDPPEFQRQSREMSQVCNSVLKNWDKIIA